jgi:hypothetical protein
MEEGSSRCHCEWHGQLARRRILAKRDGKIPVLYRSIVCGDDEQRTKLINPSSSSIVALIVPLLGMPKTERRRYFATGRIILLSL